jgi:hypothetical protein
MSRKNTIYIKMKLKDIEIPDGAVMAILGFGCIYFGACLLGLTMTIIKAISLYFFNYKIVIFGIPL